MAFEAIASLKFVWDFVSPIFGDLLKEKLLGLEKADKKAKKRVFNLYQDLERVNYSTSEFTRSFEAFVGYIINDMTQTSEFKDSKQELLSNIDELKHDLDSAATDLSSMEIQLKIHLPDFIDDFYKYEDVRGIYLKNISDRLAILNKFSKTDKDELLLILESSKSNSKLITSGIEKLRL